MNRPALVNLFSGQITQSIWQKFQERDCVALCPFAKAEFLWAVSAAGVRRWFGNHMLQANAPSSRLPPYRPPPVRVGERGAGAVQQQNAPTSVKQMQWLRLHADVAH